MRGQKSVATKPVVRRAMELGAVTVRIVETDITLCQVDAVVNAANTLSFMPMDGGVSGALRNACKPAKVTGALKKWWDNEGGEHYDKKLATTQAGVQPAMGGLQDRGVQHIVHAVGPNWSDYPIKDTTFRVVTKKIKRTVRRALCACGRVGARSVALPAISGGIFTHYKEGTDIKEREQLAARQAVLEAVLVWVSKNGGASCVRSIDLVDLPRSKLGCVHMFVEVFDKVVRLRHEPEPPPLSSPPLLSPPLPSSSPEQQLELEQNIFAEEKLVGDLEGLAVKDEPLDLEPGAV